MPRFKFGEEETKEMMALYDCGFTTTEIGEIFGVSGDTVSRYLKRAGVVIRPPGFLRGDDHHAWKGGRTKTGEGYVMVLIHPDNPFFEMGQVKADGLRYVPEHRLVMARHLGRSLTKKETVHHIDGDKTNNKLSNLQLRQGRHGKGTAMCCADCGSYNVVPVAIVAEEN